MTMSFCVAELSWIEQNTVRKSATSGEFKTRGHIHYTCTYDLLLWMQSAMSIIYDGYWRYIRILLLLLLLLLLYTNVKMQKSDLIKIGGTCRCEISEFPFHKLKFWNDQHFLDPSSLKKNQLWPPLPLPLSNWKTRFFFFSNLGQTRLLITQF